jgi:hypothetical protein
MNIPVMRVGGSYASSVRRDVLVVATFFYTRGFEEAKLSMSFFGLSTSPSFSKVAS